jgi:predicted dehydrogenase
MKQDTLSTSTQKQLAGGGALADMGIHALDTARFLLGDSQGTEGLINMKVVDAAYKSSKTGKVVEVR